MFQTMNFVSCIGLALSVIGLLSLGVSGPGYRFGLWGYKTGISLFKYSGYFGLGGVIVCLVGWALWKWKVFPDGSTHAIIGLLIGGGLLGLALMWKFTLDKYPYIHDITTDTENPPVFVAILPLRASAENSAAYEGPELARQQLASYPDLQPGSMSSPPPVAYPRSLQAAREMGWKIVECNPQSLRIEATDTTCWFGFQDDIVVRLTPSPAGTRVDVRSVSRVGKSDLGTNARRIEAYLSRMV